MTNDITCKSTLQWCHNGHEGISNHQPRHCLLNHLFRRRSKKISKFRVTGLCAGNSPVNGEFPTQMASNVENVCIWWRHHDGTSHVNDAACEGLVDRFLRGVVFMCVHCVFIMVININHERLLCMICWNCKSVCFVESMIKSKYWKLNL